MFRVWTYEQLIVGQKGTGFKQCHLFHGSCYLYPLHLWQVEAHAIMKDRQVTIV